jgi:hypothetical protein
MAEAAKEELASRKTNTSATACLMIVEYANDNNAHNCQSDDTLTDLGSRNGRGFARGDYGRQVKEVEVDSEGQWFR